MPLTASLGVDPHCMGEEGMTDFSDLTTVLFETAPERVTRSLETGISDFLVDWEWRGKERRQNEFDTEINSQTVEELAALVSIPGATAWCRINSFGPWTSEEVEIAITEGVSVLLLPMVRSVWEVEEFLRLVGGRCRAGILIETKEALHGAAEIAKCPLDVVFVGLNDLMISFGTPSIFTALASGILDTARKRLSVPLFGLGGVTVLDRGKPLPCAVFLQEMARLHCNMTFMRRSYKRDIVGRDAGREMRALKAYWRQLAKRTSSQVKADHRIFRTMAEVIDRKLVRMKKRGASLHV